jgi:hypothetical protein
MVNSTSTRRSVTHQVKPTCNAKWSRTPGPARPLAMDLLTAEEARQLLAARLGPGLAM